MTITILVHGGAGDIPEEELGAFRAGVQAAARLGWEVLACGGKALDAVEAAVRYLENQTTFDAGLGSVLNAAGEVEMDAFVMDGADLRCGAVASIQYVAHPVSVARMVMEKTQHTLLVGPGATHFAAFQGAELLPEHPALKKRARAARHLSDTVGAIALDSQGHLAVATSTGGMEGKLPGRVGDTPLIGCGAYADDQCGAAAATGVGEYLMRVVISKSACDLVASGRSPQEAAEAVIRLLKQRVDGIGGIVVMNPSGEAGGAFNTPHMVYGWIRADGEMHLAG